MDILVFVLFFAGLIAIIKGSDWFVDSVIWIAKVMRVPNFIIGATLVSLCTTLPETMVSTGSVLRKNTDMAVGNALGSIACNTGFILALTIILSRPSFKDRKRFLSKGIFLLLLIGFVAFVGLVFGEVGRPSGIVLLIIFIFYMYSNVREGKNNSSDQPEEQVVYDKKTVIKRISLFIIGLGLTILGANLLVTNGEKIAKLLGVSDIIIGLTMTALGTSLPELMTAITAIRKKAHGISIGNVFGANILNIILVIGLSSTILPIPFDETMIRFHLPFIMLIVASSVVLGLIFKNNFKRRGGFWLLGTYMLYVVMMIN